MASVSPNKPEVANGQAVVLARKPKKTPRKWLWPVVFLVVLGAGLITWTRLRAANTNTGLITGTVTKGDLIETVTATGSIEAQTGAQVHIGSQITGVIKHLYADAGANVKAGQLIAVLDLPDLEDNYNGAVAAYQGANTKYQQEVAGVQQEHVTTAEAINQAQATLVSKQQELAAAQEALKQQQVGTPTDIRKAQTALDSAKAGLATAQATYQQTVAGANLNIQNAKEAVTQATANAKLSSANLARNKSLYQQGFIASATYDQAVATDNVNQSLVGSAQETLTLTQQKVTADLQTSQQAVNQAQQAVASAQAALEAAQAENLTTDQREANVRDAAAAVDLAQAALKTAIANKANDIQKDQDVEQAKDAANTALNTQKYDKAQVDKSEIRTPIDGTVLNITSQQGETVAAGLSAPTLITVANLDKLEVEDYVSEEDIGKVKLGQAATIVVDAFPNKTFHGKVVKIYSGSTIQQNVVTYDVVVNINNKEHLLKPDMTATVNITVGQKSGVLLVPSVAIQLGTKGSTVNTLQTVNGKEELVPVAVKTGGTDGVNVEITSGLKEGQKIVLAGAPTGGPKRGPSNPFSSGSKGGGGGGSGR
jgi:RND family efflux transporter MFP subunit